MRRTPALTAAAALGLLAGLRIEARASTLTGEVRPYAVAVAWLTPGAPSPAGLEANHPGGRVAPAKGERLPKLPAMRARAPGEVPAARRAPARRPRKVLAGAGSCPGQHAHTHDAAARDVRRT
jgi:hypothetical protein